MSSRRGSLRRILLVSFIAGGCAVGSTVLPLAAQAPAPPYEELTLPEQFAVKDGQTTVFNAAKLASRETGPLSSTAKEALKLSAEFYMVRMTHIPKLNDPKEKSLSLPDDARSKLISLVTATASAEGKTVVSKAVVARAVAIINGNYMPAAKINAMLMLADPKLSASETIGVLWKFTTDPRVPAHLRCLAIVGVENQLRAQGSNIPAAQGKAIAAGVAAIVKSRPTSLPEEKAHWWLVRRSYELLSTLHRAGTPSNEGVQQAMEHLMDPYTAPSVRLSAAEYLSNYDLSAVPDVIKNKILVAVAQLLDQEVVGWYEQEDDKLKMASGAGSMSGYGGGYGGDSMMSGMSSSDAYDSSMSATMSGYESVMGGSASAGPKPIDTQKWDMRLARRKLNTYCQVAHVLLDGKALATQEKKFNANPKSKGLMEADLPEPLQRSGEKLLEALDKVQVAINERTLTTVSTLMTKSVQSLEELRTAAEMVPGIEGADGTVVVPSFDQLSPRKKSLKKADAESSLDKPEPPAAAPVDPNQPVDATQPQPVGGQAQPAGGQAQPAGGQAQPVAGQAPVASPPVQP